MKNGILIKMQKKIKDEIKLSIPLSYTKKHNTITIVFSANDDEETVIAPQSTDDTSGLYQ